LILWQMYQPRYSDKKCTTHLWFRLYKPEYVGCQLSGYYDFFSWKCYSKKSIALEISYWIDIYKNIIDRKSGNFVHLMYIH
jgi:hypothetical protein